nr:phosphoglucosamine mutase [Candidatus Bathyarchaeota archaeon]
NGGFMFGLHNQVRDGCMTLGLALDLLAKSEKSISENVSMLPLSFTTKDKVDCSADDAAKLIDKLKQENPNADTTDGIKIILGPKEWVMIRPSGTEPIIRIYGEAQSQQKLVAIMEQFIQKVKSLVSS